jgi:hypothetical protein
METTEIRKPQALSTLGLKVIIQPRERATHSASEVIDSQRSSSR